jgi:superfamily II DNA or RNA helicase
LRPYQEEAIRSIDDGWHEGVTKQLIVAATGTGKTVIMSELARRAVAAGQNVLMLAHTDELLEQAREKFAPALGVPVAKEKADSYATRFDKVVVASVQTLRRPRLITWPKNHFGLVMVDEAHRTLAKSYQAILEHFESRVVGVTATADRGDKKQLGTFYQRIAIDYGLRRACSDGWLVRPVVKTVPIEMDLRNAKTVAGDFAADDVSHAIEPFIIKIAEAIYREAADRKVLVFMPSVETSAKMAAALKMQGFAADYVHGDDSERHRKIDDYRSGKIRALCNAYLLVEGFDDDAIDCVVILRPTKIRSLYVQCCGRGTRPLSSLVKPLSEAPHAEARKELIARSPKPFVLLLDFLWLYEKHDLIQPASLMTLNPEVIARMMKKRDGDIFQLTIDAEHELLRALESQLKRNSKKQSRLVDPLTFAANIGDLDLANFEPETLWEALAVSEGQARILSQNGVDPAQVQWRGQASKIIDKIFQRSSEKLCSYRKLQWLKSHGIDATNMTDKEAKRIMNEKIQRWRNARA